MMEDGADSSRGPNKEVKITGIKFEKKVPEVRVKCNCRNWFTVTQKCQYIITCPMCGLSIKTDEVLAASFPEKDDLQRAIRNHVWPLRKNEDAVDQP